MWEKGKLLRIFIDEEDKYKGKPLFEWIINKAHDAELKTAAVLRGFEGFGIDSRIHTAKVLRLSQNLPVIVEIIDIPEKIEDFANVVNEAVTEGLMTLEEVTMTFSEKEGKDGHA